MIIHVVRILYLAIVLIFTVSYAMQPSVLTRMDANYVTMFILIPAAAATALVLVDMFWRRKRLQALSGLFFGLLAGLVIAYVLTQTVQMTRDIFSNRVRAATPALVVQADAPNALAAAPARATAASSPAPLQPAATQSAPGGTTQELTLQTADSQDDAVMQLIKMLIGASAIYMCVSFILQTRDDFRFIIPYVEFSKQTKGARVLVLDTSVIIDGRIADIAETRILESQMIVPRFVLAELQHVADSDDKLKRNRGRRGLDILNRLQNNPKIAIQIMDAHIAAVDDAPDVDAKLVALAKHLDGRVMTNDYNLNKVAQLRKVDVININDLANAMKPVVLPGEAMTVKIIKPGEEAGQGVGYLEDGTMVVAEGGREHIGKEVGITVTSVLQTSAGRMIFGRTDGVERLRPRRV